jgi:hypothetical protein
MVTNYYYDASRDKLKVKMITATKKTPRRIKAKPVRIREVSAGYLSWRCVARHEARSASSCRSRMLSHGSESTVMASGSALAKESSRGVQSEGQGESHVSRCNLISQSIEDWMTRFSRVTQLPYQTSMLTMGAIHFTIAKSRKGQVGNMQLDGHQSCGLVDRSPCRAGHSDEFERKRLSSTFAGVWPESNT